MPMLLDLYMQKKLKIDELVRNASSSTT